MEDWPVQLLRRLLLVLRGPVVLLHSGRSAVGASEGPKGSLRQDLRCAATGSYRVGDLVPDECKGIPGRNQ